MLGRAREGECIGREVSRGSSPDMVVRTEMAIEEAIKAPDIFEAGRLITASVGNGLPAYEAVPAALGYLRRPVAILSYSDCWCQYWW